MRCLFGVSLIIVAFNISIAATSALAATCTERQQVCFAYCEKTYKNAPKCRDACSDYHKKCILTGCWESNVTAKRCGFSKQ
jgi:hypothetical protein